MGASRLAYALAETPLSEDSQATQGPKSCEKPVVMPVSGSYLAWQLQLLTESRP